MLLSLMCMLLAAQTAQRPAQRHRGAEGTREFLGLGRQPDAAAAARGMPAFPALTEAQLADLAEFLHMQVELAANRGTYQVKNIVTGNASAGEA